jgi:hypothetical protein
MLVQRIRRSVIAIGCALLLTPGEALFLAQDKPPAPPPSGAPAAAPAAAAAEAPAPRLPPEQLDSLVAPIALYPDPLLAQTLVASTYPLEIIQLQQWITVHRSIRIRRSTTRRIRRGPRSSRSASE